MVKQASSVGSHAPCHILSGGVMSLSYVSRTCHTNMRICQVAGWLLAGPVLAGTVGGSTQF
jgi:hypothetical protein